MKKSFLAIVLYVFACAHTPNIQAQSIHFSQFNNQPLLLNPSLTGSEAGEYRAALTYRNQWQSIPADYSTLIASFDRSLGTCANEDSYLGIGGMVYHESFGDGALKESSAAISFAYHRQMDEVLKVSFGGQVGYTNKKIDFSNITFPGQIQDFQINPNLPSSDFLVLEDNFNYFNAKLGVSTIISLGELSQLEIGGSYNHIFEPDQTFLSPAGEANELKGLWVAHVGGEFGVSERISLNPSFLHMAKGSSRLNIGGASMAYYFNGSQEESNSISVGSWYRFDDAVIFTLGANIGRITTNVSYDLTVSDLEEATNGRGAFEVSVIYRGLTKACN
ncbi:MAG: PorP/SprF family type IX secretion system membrane protein [Chitinophagales bacterium]